MVWAPGKGGTITTGPLDAEPDQAIWDFLIADWGLDPSKTSVVPGTVQIRAWDANLGAGEVRRMKYYRATLAPAVDAVEENRVDLEPLYKEARKAKPGRKVFTGDSTLLVCLSDFQTGNPDGEGLQGQLNALAALVDSIPRRVSQLRKQGVEIGSVCIAGLGDLMEGTCGFYAAQKFRVEIDRREQIKIVRRAIRDILMSVAPVVPDVKVVCVPGNHGENRQDMKAFTRVGDNDDVAVFESVAEILAVNPEAYGHVRFRIPSDEVAVAVDLSGKRVAFTHGHVAKSKGNAAETLWGWWAGQAMGRNYPSVADADILIGGHFHHLNMKEQAGRTVFVCPSLTNVSEYYADMTGMNTREGTLSMVINSNGWSDLTLL